MAIPKPVRIVLAVFWTAFIVYGLTSEPSNMPRFPWLVQPGVDKLIHAILFGVEAYLLALIFTNLGSHKLRLLILAWCFILGGVLEVVQHYLIDGRSGDYLDLIADVAGGVFGLVVTQQFSLRNTTTS